MRSCLPLVLVAGCAFPAGDAVPADAPLGADATEVDAAPDAPAQPFTCPAAYDLAHAGHRYRLTTVNRGWDGARADCEADGGYLIKIETREEDDAAVRMVNGFYYSYFWIGLRDVGGDTYEWTDGTAPAYARWPDGTPPASATEDCIHKSAADFDGRWFAFACAREQRALCECVDRP